MVEYKCHGTIAECLECPYTDECDRDVSLEEEKIIDSAMAGIESFNIGQLIELRSKAESIKERRRYTYAIYRLRNKQKVYEREKEWNEAHRERCREFQKKYYLEHKEEIKAKKKRYYMENREIIKMRRLKKI